MSLVGQLIGPVTGLLDKFIPDADTKNKLAHEISTMSERHAQQIALEQIEVLGLTLFLVRQEHEYHPRTRYLACLRYRLTLTLRCFRLYDLFR